MEHAQLLVTIGIIFLASLFADKLGSVARLPRVTMLILLGLVVGKSGFDLIPDDVAAWFDLLSIIALTMVAFLLGSSLSGEFLASRGRAILIISLSIVFATLVIVAAGLAAVGMDKSLALVIAAIATATAPASIADIVRTTGIANSFTDTLLGIVAIDDAWGLIVFSLVLVVVGHSDGVAGFVTGAGRDLGGAVAVGALVGVPASYLTGRLRPGEPLQTEAIGLVLLTAGLAMWLDVSFLISGMVAGMLIANFARHHERAFHEIEHIQWPFMMLFFVLAGATLDIVAVETVGWIGVLYVVLRIAARLLGGYGGARLAGVPANEVPWYGPSLMSQAGVAVGMALVAGEVLPQWADLIMVLTVTSTIFFEVFGPPVTLVAIRSVAAARKKAAAESV